MAVMASKQDLEALDSVFLAIMCKKLSQDPTADAKAAEKARHFKDEWFRLTNRETPPPPQELDKIRGELATLKSQMAEFLAPYV